MDEQPARGRGPFGLNEEWTAERVARSMWLAYGAAGRTPEELQTCPHCQRTYYRSNGGACPRCGGPVRREPPRQVGFHYGLI
jgi:uncharacterized paraquat-inducible protein A